MKITEKELRDIVSEALTGKGLNYEKMRMRRWAQGSGEEPSPDLAGVMASFDSKRSPEEYALRKYTRSLKVVFDQNCEVARTGYRVRSLQLPIADELLYWNSRAEVPCSIYRNKPLLHFSAVSVLLRGGRVTFADVIDVRSGNAYTRSGVRIDPNGISSCAQDKIDETGILSWTWDEVERVAGTCEDTIGMDEEPGGRPGIMEEAFVVGSYPEAIIISKELDQYSQANIDKVMKGIEAADLPIVDPFLQLMTPERARQILRGEG
jgi:hypothetical protein